MFILLSKDDQNNLLS